MILLSEPRSESGRERPINPSVGPFLSDDQRDPPKRKGQATGNLLVHLGCATGPNSLLGRINEDRDLREAT